MFITFFIFGGRQRGNEMRISRTVYDVRRWDKSQSKAVGQDKVVPVSWA
jgi:hypothetical protein